MKKIIWCLVFVSISSFVYSDEIGKRTVYYTTNMNQVLTYYNSSTEATDAYTSTTTSKTATNGLFTSAELKELDEIIAIKGFGNNNYIVADNLEGEASDHMTWSIIVNHNNRIYIRFFLVINGQITETSGFFDR